MEVTVIISQPEVGRGGVARLPKGIIEEGKRHYEVIIN